MNIFPNNITWFLPYIKKLLSLKKLPDPKFFKLSTLELLEKTLNSSDLLEQLLTERFILENFSKGFYSLKLLELVLEEREIFGYLIKTKHSLRNFTAFKLEKDLFFYPLEWGNGLKLFYSFWKNKKNFQARGISLKKPISLESLKKSLHLLNLLDFSLLTEKTRKELENYLPSLEVEVLEELLNKFLKTSQSVFILSNFKLDPFLNSIPKVVKISSKTYLYLIEEFEEQLLNSLIMKMERETENLTAGVLSQNIFKNFAKNEVSPFIMVLGAFEHARRAQKKVVLFEGYTFHVIGDLYFEWKDFGKALKYYCLAESYTKQLLELNLSKAAIYYFLGKLEKAEKILKKLSYEGIKEDPMVHYNLGLIFLRKKKMEKAKFHFYKAYFLDSKNKLFRETLVEFLWNTKKLEEIENLLSNAEDLSFKEKACLGKVYFLKKDYERAFEMLRELLTCSERDGETSLFLAWLYLHLKKEPEISELLTREARDKLKKSQFEKILKEFNLKKNENNYTWLRYRLDKIRTKCSWLFSGGGKF